jgi:hypothetical protein
LYPNWQSAVIVGEERLIVETLQHVESPFDGVHEVNLSSFTILEVGGIVPANASTDPSTVKVASLIRRPFDSCVRVDDLRHLVEVSDGSSERIHRTLIIGVDSVVKLGKVVGQHSELVGQLFDLLW